VERRDQGNLPKTAWHAPFPGEEIRNNGGKGVHGVIDWRLVEEFELEVLANRKRA